MPADIARSSPRANGFLLAEALVALAIVAVMAAVVFETIAHLGQSALATTQRREALLVARSVIAAASVPGAHSPMAADGHELDYVWHIERAPFRDGQGAVPLEAVTVTIMGTTADGQPDGRAPLARLSSLRVLQ